VLAVDATELGREMFVSTSNLAGVPAEAIVSRDAKEYEVGAGETIAIAQVETVGQGLDERRHELLDAMREARERRGYALFALMVTDILAKDTELYVSGDAGPLEQAFGVDASDGVIPLPGVMSRKKQVAPKVLAAL
jgi:manganese-dependent inorganic pyrophosphatase